VLFYLLEIRHAVLVNNISPSDVFESFLDYYKQWLAENYQIYDVTFPDELISIIVSQLTKNALSTQSIIDEQLIVKFHNALLELSKDDPILAYKIKGREKLVEINNAQKEYLNSVQSFLDANSETIIEKIVPKTIQDKQTELFDELISEINRDIYSVSWRCGIFAYLRCHLILRKTIAHKIDFVSLGIDRELHAMFDETTKELMGPN
jgi:hypothetical protein